MEKNFIKQNNPCRRGFLTKTSSILIAGLSGCLGTQQNVKNTSAQEIFPPSENTKWSEPVEIGEGKVKTFLTRQEKKPKYIGIHITEQALKGLPDKFTDYHLHLPGSSIFKWVGIDWTPQGHEPEEIYTVPHFDIHFYMTEEEKVAKIEEGPAKYTIPENQIPEDYIRPLLVDTDNDGEPDSPLVIPKMGEHLVDPTSPEFKNESFTHTFIWGAYDNNGDGKGQLTFMEPMITKSFLEQKPKKVSKNIKMPKEVPKSGMYPTQYTIRYHSNEKAYTVTLEKFSKF